MTSTRLTLGFAWIAMMFAHPVGAQAPARADSTSVVVTSGVGEVTLAPDRAVLRLSCETRASTAAQAASENSRALHRLLDSLNAFRQPEESIKVVGVSVGPTQDERGQVRGYVAAATLRLVIRSLERLGQIIDAGFAAGATSIEGITWISDREDAGRREALGRAFGKAQENAQALAQAAGLTLGPLLRVSTEPTYGRVGAVQLQAVTATGYGRVPIAPQDVVARASVQVTWRLVAQR